MSSQPATAHIGTSRLRGMLLATVYFLALCVALPVLLIATGLRMDVLWPIQMGRSAAVGWALFLAGSALIAWSMVLLRSRGDGLSLSRLSPTSLVDRGPYRLLRHPVYVGATISLVGLAFLLGSFWILGLSTPLFLLGWLAYAQFFEERMLARRHGSDWRGYRQRTSLLGPVSAVLVSVSRQIALALRPTLQWLADHPVVFRGRRVSFVSYGLFWGLGMLLYGWSTAALLLAQRFNTQFVNIFVFLLAIVTVVGAYGFWWAGNLQTLRHERFWGLGKAGFIWYGALFGPVCFAWLTGAETWVPPFMVIDALMQGVFLVFALGRLGCLTYGCCVGIPGKAELGVCYRHPASAAPDAPSETARLPAPVYATLDALLLVGVANIMAMGNLPPGTVSALVLVFYGVGRTYTESYRDRPRRWAGLFTWGHVGAWASAALGWLMLFLIRPDATSGLSVNWWDADPGLVLSAWPGVVLGAIVVTLACGLRGPSLRSWLE